MPQRKTGRGNKIEKMGLRKGRINARTERTERPKPSMCGVAGVRDEGGCQNRRRSNSLQGEGEEDARRKTAKEGGMILQAGKSIG